MRVEVCVPKKLVSTLRNYNSGLHVYYALEVVMKAWNACTGKSELEPSNQAAGVRSLQPQGRHILVFGSLEKWYFRISSDLIMLYGVVL